MVKENVLKKSSNISSMIERRHAGRNVKTYSSTRFFQDGDITWKHGASVFWGKVPRWFTPEGKATRALMTELKNLLKVPMVMFMETPTWCKQLKWLRMWSWHHHIAKIDWNSLMKNFQHEYQWKKEDVLSARSWFTSSKTDLETLLQAFKIMACRRGCIPPSMKQIAGNLSHTISQLNPWNPISHDAKSGVCHEAMS